MSVTATEFKANFTRYIHLASTEDVYITQYGKVIAKLTQPFQDRVAVANSLLGVIPDTLTLEESRAERLEML